MTLLRMFLVAIFLVLTAQASRAQTFTTLTSFNGTNGQLPYGNLVQGTDGNYYGVTNEGGAYNAGTVFKVSTKGVLTTLHSFSYTGTDGGFPEGGLVLGTDGNFYGTTSAGGGCGGTVFKMTPSGVLTTLHAFTCRGSEGGVSYAPLVQGTDGNYYGTTAGGGMYGGGTIFKITSTGAITTLYNFCGLSGCADGKEPFLGGLVQGADGNFYGVTTFGGDANQGTVFKITSKGAFTRLYSFCAQGPCLDGSCPYGGMVQAADGNLYGTTHQGGAYGDGTLFRITTSGLLTILYSFSGEADGRAPYGTLALGSDGNIYGTTSEGGNNLLGTIFELTPSGSFQPLWSFSGGFGNPYSGVFQGTTGVFYGTTLGVAPTVGTIYSLSTGLGSFVIDVPATAKVGAKVTILGNGLKGTTSVSFNGVPAVFTVASATKITATVPTGATSGTVTVVTPTGTLNSNVPFTVSH